MPLSFGVHTSQQDLTMDALRALWRRVDGCGMDWISIWDHFYEAPPVDGMSPHFESIAALATLAAETRRVRVACLVFCVPYRNPAMLAKALTTIDHISHGCLTVGLGAGWHAPEFRAYGYRFPAVGVRLDMLEEGIQIVRGLLTQERTTFEGRHFQVHDATCRPPPVQRRLPIWIGGVGEKRTLRLTARYADGWNAPYQSPERWRHFSDVLTQWCEKEDRDPSSITRTVNLSFNLVSDRRRIPEMEETMRERHGADVERWLGGALRGLPDDVPERVAQYVEAGVQGLNIALRAPWDDDALSAYLEDMVPRMRVMFN